MISEFLDDPEGAIEDVVGVIIERLSPLADLDIDMTYFEEGASALLTVNAVFSVLKPTAICALPCPLPAPGPSEKRPPGPTFSV